MTYKEKFNYMYKAIASCKTTEQLEVCKNWITNKGLEYNDYYLLSLFIVERYNVMIGE